MQRAITAVYPTELSALEVREELVRLGIPDGHITMIPETSAAAATPGMRDSADHHDRLDRLGLPDDDTRTYLQAVRNGDFVLSVEVDDAERLDRIKAIMRDPGQARNLDALDEEYRGAEYVPFRHEDRPADPHGRATRQNSEPGERPDLRDYSRNRGPGL
jgi:predicted PhzF superfamily epimerase YddE/YHI9